MNLKELSIPSKRQYTFEERADLLDESLWGLDLKWPEVEYMAKYFEVYNFSTDTTIVKEGDKSNPYIGLVLKGKVNVIKKDLNGEEKILTSIAKGRTFGEMSVIDHLPSSASIVTMGDVMLMVLEKDNFERLIVDKPGVGNKFLLKLLKLMSARIRITSGKLVDI